MTTDRKTVPREPTHEMLLAAVRTPGHAVAPIWTAMYDAAPAPAAEPSQDYAELCARLRGLLADCDSGSPLGNAIHKAIAEIERLRAELRCSHIVSSAEGTHYCALAESQAKQAEILARGCADWQLRAATARIAALESVAAHRLADCQRLLDRAEAAEAECDRLRAENGKLQDSIEQEIIYCSHMRAELEATRKATP